MNSIGYSESELTEIETFIAQVSDLFLEELLQICVSYKDQVLFKPKDNIGLLYSPDFPERNQKYILSIFTQFVPFKCGQGLYSDAKGNHQSAIVVYPKDVEATDPNKVNAFIQILKKECVKRVKEQNELFSSDSVGEESLTFYKDSLAATMQIKEPVPSLQAMALQYMYEQICVLGRPSVPQKEILKKVNSNAKTLYDFFTVGTNKKRPLLIYTYFITSDNKGNFFFKHPIKMV